MLRILHRCFDRIQSGYKMAQRDSLQQSLQTTRRLIKQQLEWYEKEGGSVSQEKAIQLKQALQQLEEKYKLMNRKWSKHYTKIVYF